MWELGTLVTVIFAVLGFTAWYYGPRRIAYRPRISVIWYVILVDLIRGILLLFSSEPANITTIHQIVSLDLASVRGIGILYLSVACLAIQGLFMPGKTAIPFLLPQGIVAALAALGATRAMILGTYADGVVRTPIFIMADQIPAVIVAGMYWLLILLIILDKDTHARTVSIPA